MSGKVGEGGVQPLSGPLTHSVDNAEAKRTAKTKQKSFGTSEVSRTGNAPKTKESSGSVMDALRNAWKAGKSTKSASPKIDNANIARITSSSVASGQSARASVTPERMEAASVNLQNAQTGLKEAQGALKAAQDAKKELSEALQVCIDGGKPTGQARIDVAKNNYQIAQLEGKVNAMRREISKEAKVLMQSSSLSESADAGILYAENNISELESESQDLEISTKIAKLDLQLAEANFGVVPDGGEEVSEGKKMLLSAQLNLEKAKGTKDIRIIEQAQNKLDNLPIMAKLESDLEKVENGEKLVTQGQKLILKAELKLAKAEWAKDETGIRNAKNEVECLRQINEAATGEKKHLDGLRKLDLIVDNVLKKMPELDAFSKDLKEHIQLSEEFSAHIELVMKENESNGSGMGVQIYDSALMERYIKSTLSITVNYEKSTKLLGKIDLKTMCPASLERERDAGTLGSVLALSITLIQRGPRHGMFAKTLHEKCDSRYTEAMEGVRLNVEKCLKAINEGKREAEYKESISKAESELTKAKLTKNDKKIKLAENKLVVAQLEVEIARAKNEDKILPRDKKILEAQLALAKAEVTGDKEKIKEAKEALNTSLKS